MKPYSFSILLLVFGSCQSTTKKENVQKKDTHFSVCYESVSPNAMKHNNGYHEYLQLSIENDTIHGIGIGTEDGEADWTFYFSGKLLNDSIIHVSVNYQQDSIKSSTCKETWKYYPKRNTMRLTGYNRPSKGRDYKKIACDNIPTHFLEKMKTIPL
jgi:hypothetical protein